jgi:putative transposase
VEDLAVTNLLGNHRLAFAISDASWGTFSRQLAYRASWYGCELLVAPRFFASTKTCSACGTKRKVMSLSERVFVCERCGLVTDRDRNAAANLAAWGESELAARESRSRTPKCEAGSTMPEERALAVTWCDSETRSTIPATSVGQKREPAQARSST